MQHDHILKILILFLYGGFLVPWAEFEKNIFRIWSSGVPCLCWSGIIYAILVEGNMGNLHVK